MFILSSYIGLSKLLPQIPLCCKINYHCTVCLLHSSYNAHSSCGELSKLVMEKGEEARPAFFFKKREPLP